MQPPPAARGPGPPAAGVTGRPGRYCASGRGSIGNQGYRPTHESTSPAGDHLPLVNILLNRLETLANWKTQFNYDIMFLVWDDNVTRVLIESQLI